MVFVNLRIVAMDLAVSWLNVFESYKMQDCICSRRNTTGILLKIAQKF